eukprot:scaffold90678_cov36-Phaeocystis_antarctica.AAC.1
MHKKGRPPVDWTGLPMLREPRRGLKLFTRKKENEVAAARLETTPRAWDGREDTRRKLNKAIAPYVTVDFVSTRPAVKTDPSPAFEAALGFARAAAHPDPA